MTRCMSAALTALFFTSVIAVPVASQAAAAAPEPAKMIAVALVRDSGDAALERKVAFYAHRALDALEAIPADARFDALTVDAVTPQQVSDALERYRRAAGEAGVDPVRAMAVLAGQVGAAGQAREIEAAAADIEEETQITGVTQLSADVAVPAAPDLPPVLADILSRVEGEGSNRTFTVRKGDLLGDIAAAVYGDVLYYKDLYAANRGVLRNPHSVEVGTVLSLPPL